MIVIEGADDVGKTTFAHKLIARLDELGVHMSYQHMSKPGDDFDFVLGYVEMMGRNVVQDRFHLGEFVYGGLFYGCRSNPEKLRLVRMYLAAVGGLIVIMAGTEQFHLMRGTDREKQMFGAENNLMISEAYMSFKHQPWLYDIFFELNDEYLPDSAISLVIDEWLKRQSAIDEHRNALAVLDDKTRAKLLRIVG